MAEATLKLLQQASPAPSETPQPTETPIPLLYGDVDRNESIEAADALCILQYVVKLVSDLPIINEEPFSLRNCPNMLY